MRANLRVTAALKNPNFQRKREPAGRSLRRRPTKHFIRTGHPGASRLPSFARRGVHLRHKAGRPYPEFQREIPPTPDMQDLFAAL